MGNIIGIRFDDFKSLAGDKRIYYYVGEGFYEFHYFVDGMIIKTRLLEEQIENKQRFFSDPLFYNAIQLMFRIKDPENNVLQDIVGIRKILPEPIIDIQEIQDEEVKQTDFQEEGVE